MSSRQLKVAPSILSADFRILEKELIAIEQAGADLIHCDIMDGTFVPNISFGPMIVDFVNKSVKTPLDVHLMIINPEKYIQAFADAGADIITVHAEACDDLPAVIELIKKSGAKVGVTVNPDKPVDLFLPYLKEIDLVLIMSVYAGFGGQKFIPETMDKVKAVYDEGVRIGHIPDIEVDGGVTDETAVECIKHGANVLVAGSYVFKGDYSDRIAKIRQSENHLL